MIASAQATDRATYAKATRPTLYFIGVTTGQSSIMQVFPRWAAHLGLGDVAIRGVDCRLHDEPQIYRGVVRHIKQDALSFGALVTTHKIDLLQACQDLFDELDPYAALMGEVSCICKRDGKLIGHAKDPITSGLALDAFLPESHWSRTGAEVFVIGAGGSSIAVTCSLMDESRRSEKPDRIIVSSRSFPRLEQMRRIHQAVGSPVPTEYVLAATSRENDAVVSSLKPRSLVINATGLGKDAPGSPLTAAARFPDHGYAWDFNYRGDLAFLQQARRQQEERHLHIEDGWTYFLHGWTRTIAQVFQIEIPTKGAAFDELAQIAATTRVCQA
jgi:shikimate 5-dehydrogenase